jgi:predicted Ser/Thr protein kinase
MAELHLVRVSSPDQRGRLMVVKRLHPKLAIDPEFVRMFVDEARIASKLRHPNVVEVYEIGEDDGQYYIAMEHLHGHDLRDALVRMIGRHVRVTIEQALTIARGVAAGLHYTHERTDADGSLLGIVHRDVSPHNVILTYDGDVKIVDFGVAKASIQLSRTRTGVLKGKVAYMAPEQARGQPLDRRSDVFCIGILLWEMMTGRWLFRRRTELETMNAVVDSRPPRPSRLISNIPRDFERLVMKTLARSRDERWATAGELIEAIDELARRRRYALGTQAVSALMATAFSDELTAWRAAQSSGTSLGDHLVAQIETTPDPDDDDDDLPPVAALGTVAGDFAPRRRWLWPALGGAAAAAAALWVVSVGRGGRALPPEPAAPIPAHVEPAAAIPAGPTGAPAPTASPVPAAAPVPAEATQAQPSSGSGTAALPAPQTVIPSGPSGPSVPSATRRPTSGQSPATPPLAKPAVAKPVVAKPALAKPPPANPPRSPEHEVAEPPPRKPAQPRSRPTIEDLDKVPP